MSKSPNLVTAFELMWSGGSRPELVDYVAQHAGLVCGQLCRLALIDQTERWRRGEPRVAEAYFNEFPCLRADGDSAVDLIHHEYVLRRHQGEQPSVEEFVSRFPEHAPLIAAQISFHDALGGNFEECRAKAGTGGTSLQSPAAINGAANGAGASPGTGLGPDMPRSFGRYELLARVGCGSFGTVFKARDPELDRIVAIKIPRDSHALGGGDFDRFLREARSAAQLRHPSIVAVHEFGRSGETPFLVSEFIEGTTLAEQMSTHARSPRDVADLIATLADALHYAHEMGVVHRDVTPANIMLDESGRPRLMDFGLARRVTGDATMTIDGQLMGTPAYMSPEQARGEARGVDGRSDIYSLGVILYQMLSGELPFRGTTQVLLHQLLSEEPRRPRSFNQLVPGDLETICLKAMAKEAPRRYVTARDMADDLRRYLRGEPIRARPAGAIERMWRWCRIRPVQSGLSVIVGILLAAIAVGGTAIITMLLAVMAMSGSLAALQFRRQARRENLLRNVAVENLYYHLIALAHRDLTAPLPRPGRAEELLDACPPEHRRWEWHYLKRLWRSEPTVLRFPQSGKLRGVAFSHDGRRIAAACGDGRIRVWERSTGEMVVLAGHGSFVYSVAFSPIDSALVASSGNDGCIRLWDLDTRRELLVPALPGLRVFAVGMAYCVAFSPDGRWIAGASEAGTVQVWESATGVLSQRLAGHAVQASCVAYSRDGRYLASGDWGGVVRIWNTDTGSLVHQLRLADASWPVASLSFSPDADSRFLAAGHFDGHINVWGTSNGTIYRELRGHIGFITSVAFHPREIRRLATAGEDRDVRIWDIPTGRDVLHLQGHIDSCSGLAFSPDGRCLASASYDQTVRLWDASAVGGELRRELHSLAVENDVWTVAISRDGTRIAAGGERMDVRVWDTRTGQVCRCLSGCFQSVVFSLAFSPDGRRIAATGFDQGAPPTVLKVFDLETGHELLQHREGQEIFAVQFSPDGRRLAFGLADGSVKLADATTGREIVALGKHDDPIAYGALQFRHDCRYLASASLDGTARVWSLPHASCNSPEKMGCNTQSAPAQLCVGGSGAAPGIALWSVAYSPDGRSLVTGDKDGHLTLWDAETGDRLERRSDAARRAYLSVAYSPNGRWIVTGSEDCTARVYDARTMGLIHRFRGHLGPIRSLAVSDAFIVTGGTDKRVKIWDLSMLAGNSVDRDCSNSLELASPSGKFGG